MKTSLPKRSEHVSEQLAVITTVLSDLIGTDLAMLLLFGPYARGDCVRAQYAEETASISTRVTSTCWW